MDFQGITRVSHGGKPGPRPPTWEGAFLGDAPWAHRRPGYPLSGCVPAEPDSVSPGEIENNLNPGRAASRPGEAGSGIARHQAAKVRNT